MPLLDCFFKAESVPDIQSGDMKHRLGNRIEGTTGCPSWCRPLRPLFHFLDDVSYPQSVELPSIGLVWTVQPIIPYLVPILLANAVYS